ncbi:hypothetical protein JHW43_003992 [Diplocarpon mali]|nr:hypothetical protein JHW43_003992 [Diplocarpon mali]
MLSSKPSTSNTAPRWPSTHRFDATPLDFEFSPPDSPVVKPARDLWEADFLYKLGRHRHISEILKMLCKESPEEKEVKRSSLGRYDGSWNSKGEGTTSNAGERSGQAVADAPVKPHSPSLDRSLGVIRSALKLLDPWRARARGGRREPGGGLSGGVLAAASNGVCGVEGGGQGRIGEESGGRGDDRVLVGRTRSPRGVMGCTRGRVWRKGGCGRVSGEGCYRRPLLTSRAPGAEAYLRVMAACNHHGDSEPDPADEREREESVTDTTSSSSSRVHSERGSALRRPRVPARFVDSSAVCRMAISSGPGQCATRGHLSQCSHSLWTPQHLSSRRISSRGGKALAPVSRLAWEAYDKEKWLRTGAGNLVALVSAAADDLGSVRGEFWLWHLPG